MKRVFETLFVIQVGPPHWHKTVATYQTCQRYYYCCYCY